MENSLVVMGCPTLEAVLMVEHAIWLTHKEYERFFNYTVRDAARMEVLSPGQFHIA